MLPQAVLFDLDDTLLDDNKASEVAWQKACVMCSSKTHSISSDMLFTRIDFLRKRYWRDAKRNRADDPGRLNYSVARMFIVREALTELGCNTDELANEIVNNYTALKTKSFVFIEKAENVLTELKKRGVRLALLTNGEGYEQRIKIERYGIRNYFDICLVEGELGYGKPDPRIFASALDKLKVSAKDAWMVGNDLHFDIGGARQSGIYAVWCDYKRAGLPMDSPVKPDRIIHNIAEILN